jgi:hypothetical protein
VLDWRIAIGFIFIITLIGCEEPQDTNITHKISQDFKQADEIRFIDMRPGHHEEIKLKQKSLLKKLSESIQGSKQVSSSEERVVGRLELFEQGQLIATFNYHTGGTLEGVENKESVSFKPQASFHPTLYIAIHRDWYRPAR